MGLVQKAVHLFVFRGSLALVCLGTIFSLVTTCASAQTSQVGTVAGQVTDESKAAVPGAAIKMTDTSTNASLTTTSNSEGRYVFGSVSPGTYNLSFVKQGFSTYEVNGQTVAISSVLTINAMLRVGSTATTVEVSASAGAELQTMNATVGGSLNGQALLLLPNWPRRDLHGGAAAGLPRPAGKSLAARRTPIPTRWTAPILPTTCRETSSATRRIIRAWAEARAAVVPSGVIPTPIESIEEIKVNVSNQTSDFNNSSGGQIQMATKRGTNQIHGSAYGWYFDTTVGSARSWSANHTPADRQWRLLRVYADRFQPSRPVRRRSRRPSRSQGPPGGRSGISSSTMKGCATLTPAAIQPIVPTALFEAGVIQVQNTQGSISRRTI